MSKIGTLGFVWFTSTVDILYNINSATTFGGQFGKKAEEFVLENKSSLFSLCRVTSLIIYY